MARSPLGRICGSGCVDEWSGAGLGCACGWLVVALVVARSAGLDVGDA